MPTSTESTRCPNCQSVEEDDHEGVCLCCGMTHLARVGRTMRRAQRGGQRPKRYSDKPMRLERRAQELAILEALFS